MIPLPDKLKTKAIEILAEAFDSNLSINWIVGERKGKEKRIRTLITYAVNYCADSGMAFMSEDASAFVLCIRKNKMNVQFSTWFRMVLLPLRVMGLSKTFKLLAREKYIKSHHPQGDYFNVWFVGVDSQSQGKGKGKKLMQEVMEMAKNEGVSIHLETSNPKNLPFYQSLGFELFHSWSGTGYTTYFFKWS